eukprot:gene16005-22143_t
MDSGFSSRDSIEVRSKPVDLEDASDQGLIRPPASQALFSARPQNSENLVLVLLGFHTPKILRSTFYSAGVGGRRFQIQQQAVAKDDMFMENAMSEQAISKDNLSSLGEALSNKQGTISGMWHPEKWTDMDRQECLQKNGFSFLAPIMPGVAPQALAGLKPIVIAEVLQSDNMIHSGRVIFLTIVEVAYRTVGTSVRTIGTSVSVRDIEGNIMTLKLYNYFPAEVVPRTIMPAGTRIALVEPYMRFTRENAYQPDKEDVELYLRCDNPQAVHVLSERRYEQCTVHSDLKWMEELEVIQVSAAAAAELSQQGSQAFSGGRLLEAIGLYNKALITAPPEDPARARFLCNRAQCHVRKGRWSDALADSEEVLQMDPTCTQSAYYKALALLMLQRPLEAREAAADPLLDGMAKSGNTEAAAYVSALRADIERAVLEQESGAYDLQALLKESVVGAEFPGCVSQCHCDYESPHIKMVEGSKAKGRCMVAEKSIKAGTLLMAAKAFVFEPPVNGNKVEITVLDAMIDYMNRDLRSSARILARVVQALLDRPESSSELYTLSAGPDFDGKPLPGYTGAVDVRRREILGINCYGVIEYEFCQDLKEQRWMEKSGRLLSPSKRLDGLQVLRQRPQYMTGTGLWIRPSLFNHSCLPNSNYFIVGNFLFISNIRDVEAGEELSITYVDPMKPLEERTEALAGWNYGNGFECDCVRCEAYRRHPRPMHEDMLMILPQMRAMLRTGRWQPDKAIPIYQRMLDIHASVLGTYGSPSSVRDSLSLAAVAIEAGNQNVARQSILAAFKWACLPGWHGLPMSVPDFHLLIKAHGNITPEDERVSAFFPYIRLVAEANAATGYLAIQK